MVAARGEGGFKFEWPVRQAPQTPLSVPRVAIIQEELTYFLSPCRHLAVRGSQGSDDFRGSRVGLGLPWWLSQ